MTKKDVFNAMAALNFLKGHKGPMSGLTPVFGTGKRAMIMGEAPQHGTPMKYANLMGGKRLVMSGKDKGKII